MALANHGNTPSLWQESTTATASLVPRQRHTHGAGNAGGPGKLETVSALNDRWSLEELRNEESHWSFHRGKRMPFYDQSSLPASPVCVIGLQ